MSSSIIFSSALFSTVLMLLGGVICFVLHYDIPNDHSSSNQNLYIGQPVRMIQTRVFLGLGYVLHVAAPSIVTPRMFTNSGTFIRTNTGWTTVL